MIAGAPADKPVTVPLVPTTLTKPLKLLQVPPDVPSVNVMDPPTHILPGAGMEIPAGAGFTDTTVVDVPLQPDPDAA